MSCYSLYVLKEARVRLSPEEYVPSFIRVFPSTGCVCSECSPCFPAFPELVFSSSLARVFCVRALAVGAEDSSDPAGDAGDAGREELGVGA